MEGTEFVLAIISIAMGAGIIITAITKGTDLIKTWLNRGSGYDEETFERLARAFMQHKKEMSERVRQLEQILKKQDDTDFRQIEAPFDDEKEEESILSNDLEQKKRARQ